MKETHLLPGLSEEEIAQENALRGLEGRKKISRKRNRHKELSYGIQAPTNSTPLWMTPLPDLRSVEILSEWLLQQSETIQGAVLDYLDRPNQDQFIAALSLIDREFPLIESRETTLMELMLNAMPATIDDMVLMARREHNSKRPSAAVRQNIRNLVKRKEAWVDEEGRYHYLYENRKEDPHTSQRDNESAKPGRPRATRTIGTRREEEERRRKDKDTRQATKEKRQRTIERLHRRRGIGRFKKGAKKKSS